MNIRFSVLLVTLLVLLLTTPSLGRSQYGVVLLLGAFTAVLAAGTLAVAGRRWPRHAALALALAGLACDATAHLTENAALMATTRAIYAVFLTFVCGCILARIVFEERVSTDTVLGGICVYLLIGMVFYQLFSLIETVAPGAFLQGGAPLLDVTGRAGGAGRYPELVYYSFVTLTTLGYGDIAPARSLPQSLAALEAVVGQLYVAILIARLVGMHLVQNPRRGS